MSRLRRLLLRPALEGARFAQHRFRMVRSVVRARTALRGGEEIRLAFGAGDVAGSCGWTTVDLTQGCDLYWDLRRPLPFPAESVMGVYSSHFFEHLSFREGERLLAECLRVLRPAGSFSICVPNARLYLEAYVKRTRLDPETLLGWAPAFNGTTVIDYVNYIAYMDGLHKYMFDEENLLFVLRRAGFREVRARERDETLDSPERDFQSIYAEARK